MPGSTPYGFHEGSRSEYLAQYAFASWGTAVVVPQQEDHGLDLHCTLMQQVGRRWMAKYPFTVQVKSEMKAVLFDGKEAVRWVIEHPLPLFLCIVDKASARMSVYNTLARFHAWSLGQLPDRLSMIPHRATPGQEGRCSQWTGSHDLSLDQPILDFSINEMLDKVFWKKAREVFEHWVEVDNDNITRVRNRLLACRVPNAYKTNDTWIGGWVEISLAYPDEEQFDQTTAGLRESVAWVADQLHRNGDVDGAAKAALFHRHLFPDDHGGLLHRVQLALNGRLGREGYAYAGVDFLGAVIQNALTEDSKTTG